MFDLKNMQQAIRLFVAMAKSNQSWRATTFAITDDVVAGMMQRNAPSLAMTPRLIVTAVLLYGPFFMKRLMPRIELLQKVQTTPPPEAYQISELQVAPAYRDRGLGSIILDYAEKEALSASCPSKALQTWTINPAIRLYKRAGFQIVETCTDEAFKSLTGAEGNHLMVKELAPT